MPRLRSKNSFIAILLCCCIVLLLSENTHMQLIPDSKQQFYSLTNKLTMIDLETPTNENISFTFETDLLINSVWHSNTEQLLQIYFLDSTVRAYNTKSKNYVKRKLTKIPDRAFYISLIKGKPRKVIAHSSRDQSLLNLQRGIASLLQLQNKNGAVREIDGSGQCNTFYNVKSSTKIKKTKTDCSHWDLRVAYRSEKPLGVSVQSREIIEYDLTESGHLEQVVSTETHRMFLTSMPESGNLVKSELVLKHVSSSNEVIEQMNYSTINDAIKSLLDWYRIFDIECDVDGDISGKLTENSLKQQIARHTSQFSSERVGTQMLAATIADLLPLARLTKQAEFLEILKEFPKIREQVVDLLAAAQTNQAHNAINKFFNYNKNSDIEMIEKYMQSLAVATHPDRFILVDLYARLTSEEEPIENAKLYDTILQTLAAITHQMGFDPSDELKQHIRTFILTRLQKCADIACKTSFIRALQNLQDASTIDVLIQNAMESEMVVSVAAMQALHSFPIARFGEKERKVFEEIFYQKVRKYDTSARILALDILLLLKPTKEQLGHLVDYLASSDTQFEIKTFVIQKLSMLSEKCARFKGLLKTCLAERPHVYNYNVMAPGGLTTVLTRKLSTAPAFNETLLSVQEINKGVLKRGSVDLILNAGLDDITTFKLGIFTNGLSSFVSDDAADVEDETVDAPISAGMEISVQGVLLRPLIFFTGNSELMGHVWSGTASEFTPAYQSTVVTQDHEQYVVLSSGATMFMRFNGAMSVDLKGKVNFSIWNRNAETQIQQNTGATIMGLIEAGFPFAKVKNELQMQNAPQISLEAKIDFYSGIKLCMQLERPSMTLSYSKSKAVTLYTDKYYKLTQYLNFSHTIPGHTLALNQKNNEMCNMLME